MDNRRTKIVATLGPATSDRSVIERLMKAGVNVFRLNFSHGTHEGHAAHIRHIREEAEKLEHPATLLQDLQGPKIRTGPVEGGKVELSQGQSCILTTEPVKCTSNIVSVDFSDLPTSVKPGDRILLDDGNLELLVVAINDIDKTVETKVILGGVLKSNKGVNLPGARLNIPSFTQKDREDLAFGMAQGVDAIAMSFVRSATDIAKLRQEMKRIDPNYKSIPIIAKLEKPEALKNLDSILESADGVMIARGDMAVEMSPEEVPIAQKEIIEMANRKAKIVITATQMLESMINNPRPTRAEASDVANAIFDGSDAVMLSGETAIGKYPIQTVELMGAIIRRAESQLSRWGHWTGKLGISDYSEEGEEKTTHDDALSITRAARELAHDRNVAAIAVFTQTGRTANLMAKARPAVPILAFTPEKNTYHQLPLLWGVRPYLAPYAETLEEMLREVEAIIITATPLRPGQQVILISGFPVGAMRPPNIALLHTIGELPNS